MARCEYYQVVFLFSLEIRDVQVQQEIKAGGLTRDADFGELFVSERLCGSKPVVSKGKQMLLSPVALCREQGAAMGVYGFKCAP